MTIANDIENNIALSQYGMRKPCFELVESELQLRGTPVPERTRIGAGLSHEFPAFLSPHPVHDFLDSRSALYAALFEFLSRWGPIRELWEQKGLLYPQAGIFYAGQVGVLLHSPSGRLEGAWQLTQRLLSEWASDTRQAQARPVLLLIPSHLQVHQDLLAQVLADNSLPAETFDSDYPNRRLAAFCDSEGIDVIDLLPGFRAAAGGDALYYRQNPHWNRAGHRLAAELIAGQWASLVGEPQSPETSR